MDFSLPKMVQNGIKWFFSSKNGSEHNYLGFFREMVRNEIPRFFSSEKWFGTKFRGFSLSRNGLERNSEGFSLLRNGLELNSEVFLFCETGGIPTELMSVPSCSAFRGIICCQKMATLIHRES